MFQKFDDRVGLRFWTLELPQSSDAKVHKKVAPQLWGGSLTFRNVGLLLCVSGLQEYAKYFYCCGPPYLSRAHANFY